jgi:hypothetical protein
MRTIKIFFTVLLFQSLVLKLQAQELKCKVSIQSPLLQNTDDKRILSNLEKAIYEFMNNRSWTKNVYAANEKIECNLIINIAEKGSNNEYVGTMLVTSARPTFKSNLNSTLLNFQDEDFKVKYQENQPLEFNVNSSISNLTSILAYYAYVIIGFDDDSFAKNGGTENFAVAKQVVNNAQQNPEPGWKPFDKNRNNRYWLLENYMSAQFAPMRDCYYEYHRQGLDIMTDKTDEGKAKITKAIKLLEPIYQQRPGNMMLQLFCSIKRAEIINIYSQGPMPERQEMLQFMSNLDPANASKYQKMVEGR